MTPADPADPVQQRRRRAAQRAAARLHHPDAGGNADDLIEAFAEIDRPRPPAVTPSVRPSVRRPPPTGWRKTLRALMPRRRRYIDIDSTTNRSTRR